MWFLYPPPPLSSDLCQNVVISMQLYIYMHDLQKNFTQPPPTSQTMSLELHSLRMHVYVMYRCRLALSSNDTVFYVFRGKPYFSNFQFLTKSIMRFMYDKIPTQMWLAHLRSLHFRWHLRSFVLFFCYLPYNTYN